MKGACIETTSPIWRVLIRECNPFLLIRFAVCISVCCNSSTIPCNRAATRDLGSTAKAEHKHTFNHAIHCSSAYSSHTIYSKSHTAHYKLHVITEFRMQSLIGFLTTYVWHTSMWHSNTVVTWLIAVCNVQWKAWSYCVLPPFLALVLLRAIYSTSVQWDVAWHSLPFCPCLQ